MSFGAQLRDVLDPLQRHPMATLRFLKTNDSSIEQNQDEGISLSTVPAQTELEGWHGASPAPFFNRPFLALSQSL